MMRKDQEPEEAVAKSRTATVVVDYQTDFITGSLGGPGREEIVHAIIACLKTSDVRIASRDWHPADHCSFAANPKFVDGSWPVHCVQGTAGASIDRRVVPFIDYTLSKGTHRQREAYSAAQGLDPLGRSLYEILTFERIAKVTVVGLCTDYCVRATVLDLVNRWPVKVPLNAVRGVAPETTDAALREMRTAGAIVLG